MHLAAKLPDDVTFISHVARTLDALGSYAPTPHIAVAVSGGADSMALALAAHAWAQAHGGRITALTIDHGLRAASADEVHQVARWMQAHSIACEILRVDVARAGNLQANARDARYLALTTWCRDHHVLHLCTGHHADDQAETIALHNNRGTTADGGSAMAAVSLRGSVRILRPLLALRKSALTDYLRSINQPWIDDPSNHSDAFARNRLRGTLNVDALCAEADQHARARHAREQAHAHHAAS